MAARDPAPVPEDPAARQRIRAETPPPHYWRRWTRDAVETPAEAEALAPAARPPSAPGAAAAPGATWTGPEPTPAPVLNPTDEEPYRILVVEDDRPQALFAQSVLHGAGMQAEVLMQPEGLIEAITRFEPDLILMDLHLPGVDGKRLTTLVRQQPGCQLLPIVFLTGEPDTDRQFEVLEAGADDCLVKPVRPRHLIAALSNRIQRSRAQRELANAAAPTVAVPTLRSHPETGLATRSWLLQQVDEMLQAGTDGGLFFVEISGALSLRERFGYAAFERLMAEAGRRLAVIAAPAPLARLNDNSFLALVRDTTPEQLQGIAAEVRARLATETFQVREGEPLQLRSAVGHAALPGGFDSATAALEATERAALQARLLPEGVAGYVPPSAQEEQEQMALLEGEIELAYQPVVAVAGSDQARYQVLMRLRQADGTVLSAGQVVPAAEASGRITDLDQQVMEHALDLVARRARDGSPLQLFVSQSPRTLVREAYADWLLQAISARGIDGGAVIIDLRLADALVHSVALASFCQRMMQVGVQFCLGQYEPGPEAEVLLGQLQLGYMRMAGRFAAAHNDQKLRDQLREVIDKAHGLGLLVIGQQIEDPQAAAAMWMAGIDFVQGNLVSSVGSELDFDFQNAVL
ncbi:response regulator receiver modulated diguanylate cyclase/phosphodiesterase [Pseudoxanthomonas suwonensis 11-1]|uniref:Response regulator receiver modulated diguanylate cyclase/phosphodiesterase n=1 Tax=Pseudoxanthomonas suwonensis (strain 11-1) TaxID=743721 RepID=E6WPK3_PSEUU|nr:EAL domain-containing response regulator [Pseudoxanthomonas suwonensis]ADV26247.1 response regulator receiver modulated diguanylate cyclase/phosphodiesterase [Pseudoxanthomonas suwonensis 11-1]